MGLGCHAWCCRNRQPWRPTSGCRPSSPPGRRSSRSASVKPGSRCTPAEPAARPGRRPDRLRSRRRDRPAREAAAGYWTRRGLPTDASQVLLGPGSKPLLFALLHAAGGEVVLPTPAWVSYAAQSHLLGREPIRVPCPKAKAACPTPGDGRGGARGARRGPGPAPRRGHPAGQPDRTPRLRGGRWRPCARPRANSTSSSWPTRSTATSCSRTGRSPPPPRGRPSGR